MTASDAALLIAALPLPAVLIDRAERIEAANAAAAQIWGHDGTGRHYVTVLRQPAVLAAVAAALGDGVAREVRVMTVDGPRDAAWRVAVRPVALAGGARALVTFEDLSAVEEAGRSRRDFVANVSHELRTPLTALLGFVETLRGPARDDAQARERFLGVIEREAARMARLVDDLLSLSRVEAEERRRPTARVELAALVRSVAQTFEDMLRRSGSELALELPAEELEVPGDAGQIRQVLTNLLENAVKYGEGGRVTVTLSGPAEEMGVGRGVRLTVADQGRGIAAHHLPRLTERFYRVDDHRSREVGGTGLGLAIVKHVVSRHRGRLWIESEPGRGSRFSVVLPAQ